MDIPYTFRHSKRAKYISMRVLPRQGLEIVLPLGYSCADGLHFLNKHQGWVKKHENLLLIDHKESNLIRTIHLPYLTLSIKICYLIDPSCRIRLKQTLEDVIVLSGNIKTSTCCHPHLNNWLKTMGKRHLVPFLQTLSQETQLTFRSVSIRLQRTRWGSCSEDGNINLNARLLFFPQEIVRYVLIHELCHLKHMNHSNRFWKLVARFVPNYRQLREQLKDGPHIQI